MSSQIDIEDKYLEQLKELLVVHVPQAEVWAYGSRVSGGGHETSDLDIVLRNPKNLTETVPGFFDIKDAIQQSTIPILVDVHDWALLPESFHKEINKQYIVVQSSL